MHEEGQEAVYWVEGKEDERVNSIAKNDKATSQLTAWFQLNKVCSTKQIDMRHLLYLD